MENKELAIFDNEKFGNLRWIMRDGDPWFVAKDAAEALEYPETSLNQINNLVRHVPDEWKGRNQIMTPGGPQEMLVLSEPGLYFFLARSDKPKALPFQKWVCEEVLPSIRKTGKYAVSSSATISIDEKLRLANKMLDTAGVSKTMRLLIMGDIIQKTTGFDAIEECHMNLPIASGEPVLTPKEIAEALGPNFGDIGIRMILGEMGLQEYIQREWQLTKEGEKYGMDYPPIYDKRKNTWSDYNIKWRPIIIDKIRLHLGLIFQEYDHQYDFNRPGDFSI